MRGPRSWMRPRLQLLRAAASPVGRLWRGQHHRRGSRRLQRTDAANCAWDHACIRIRIRIFSSAGAGAPGASDGVVRGAVGGAGHVACGAGPAAAAGAGSLAVSPWSERQTYSYTK